MTKPIPELLALARDVEREAREYATEVFDGLCVPDVKRALELSNLAGSHAMHAKLAPVIEEMGRALEHYHANEEQDSEGKMKCRVARNALAKVRGMLGEKP
jgi:hypothetical protein